MSFHWNETIKPANIRFEWERKQKKNKIKLRLKKRGEIQKLWSQA